MTKFKKTIKTADPIAKARTNKRFPYESMFAKLAIRLGVKVREKRILKGWEQQDLADAIKAKSELILIIEMGESTININTLKILIDALDFTKEDLAWIFETET